MEVMNKTNIIDSKDNFKILLISINNSSRYSNAGVDQLTGYLRKHRYRTDIKYYHKKQNAETIIKDIPLGYNVYGFSVYSSNYERCLKIAKYIKETTPNSIICFGGSFPTMYYNEIMNECKHLDYIILGDGEEPLKLLVDNILSKTEKDLKSDYIVTRFDKANKRVCCNSEILHKSVFDFYELDTKEKNIRKVHCIQTKNNVCTGNCSFCFERKGKIVYKDIEQIVEEIEFVAKKYGIKKFYFSDDNLLDPNTRVAKERIKELCYKIKSLNMKLVFTCFIKAISFEDLEFDNELLQLMSETGFATMFIGIESGNNRDLVLYNKHTTVDNNYTIVNLLERHDIIPMMGFINFNPYSTVDTLKENYKFLIKTRSINLFHYVCAFLSVYKNTAIYNKMKNDGLLKSTYSILNDMEYEFNDENVSKIVNFIREKMIPRVKKLDIELDWLMHYYSECKRINSEAKKFESELYGLKDVQFKIINEFFSKLYIENNLEKCERDVEEFLMYFESIQTLLLPIYKELISLYNC